MTSPSSVTEMFDGIAGSYDVLNHRLSFGIDRIWRRRTSRLVAKHHPANILDVATGTADLAIRMAKDNPETSITGVDLSTEMLTIGQRKINQSKLSERIRLLTADATSMPFSDGSFDVVTAAFGVRNFTDREAGLCEMARVCRNNGLVAVLEFSHPTSILVKGTYRWYSRHLIPTIGRKVSKHPSAYTYLPTSVEAFPSAKVFKSMMEQAGINDIQSITFSGGIATLYYGYVLKNAVSSQ